MAEEGNIRELGAHWVDEMGLCMGQRALNLGHVRDQCQGQGWMLSFIQGQEPSLSPESELELKLIL